MRTAAAAIGILAETSLHPGGEAGGGAIDLPVSREATTGYPIVPGSSLKGTLRAKFERLWVKDPTDVFSVFGRPDQVGGIAVTDARLLLLPVRSLTGHFKWTVCPYQLERLERDLRLAGLDCNFPPLKVGRGQALGLVGSSIMLEELLFQVTAAKDAIDKVAEVLTKLIPHQSVRERLRSDLLIIGDDDFAHLAEFGLAVSARNQLSDKTKTSANLWYEETLPPDTLMYALLLARPDRPDPLAALIKGLVDTPYLQVGGNESVGQGWCRLIPWARLEA